MARKLDILVPHWKETREDMEPLLDSILVQQGVDLSEVGVIIAYDGPEASELPVGEWAERYPFEIEHVHADKGGVSHTRNAAFDAGSGEYCCFVDADDMYCDVCAFYILFREMEGAGFDVLVSVFREQTKGPDGNLTFINRGDMMRDGIDQVFVHGKCYNRKFLEDNRIRFSDPLTVHEDSFHTGLALAVAKPDRTKFSGQPFFLWRWRDDSVCRHDPDYILKTLPNLIASADALVSELIQRMMPEQARMRVGAMVLDIYYTLNKPEWLNVGNAAYRKKVERDFAAFYRKYRSLWDELSEQEKTAISNGIRARSVGEGMLMEPITLADWLKKILRENKAPGKKKPSAVV